MPLLLVLCAVTFVSAFSNRIVDPLVPAMARDLHVEVATAALLSSAYTFPYALSQPLLGAIGDQLGKERVIKICTGMLVVALALAIFAPDFGTLFAARVFAGVAGGGLIPIAFAIVGDHVAVAQRQSALAQLVMASQMAVLLGSALSGMIAVQTGWRGIFVIAAGVALVSFLMLLRALPTPPRGEPTPLSLARMRNQYSDVLRSRLAPVVLGAVAVEGMAMFGLFPYVAARLETRAFGSTWEAGLVIAAMSVGGIIYTLLVRHLLRLLGPEGLIRTGGVVSLLAMSGVAFSWSWPVEALMFSVLGFGFFCIHNSLQLQATELAPTARASSVALFAFCFFLGQAIGPLLYRVGFEALGIHLPIVIAGAMLLAISFGVAFRLNLRPSARS